MANEDFIRDQLSTRLDLIEKNLTLKQKEFKLNNHVGAKGFIDLLATDSYGNFVIIEIKRTKASSRETIQEILKYIALIKQNYNARDSEIRTIIVSVEWAELLVPFSELLQHTSLTVKGLKLFLDINGGPIRCEQIAPLSRKSIARKFSSDYSIYLFATEQKRKMAEEAIRIKVAQIGIQHFVMLEMNGDKSFDPRLVHPFALCLALQEISVEDCETILNKSAHYVDEEIEFEDEEHKLNYFNECIQIEIVRDVKLHDSFENGTPEKIHHELTRGAWNLGEIFRYGHYLTDPRYDQQMLLHEIQGLDGKNQHFYLNFCESTHLDRFREIVENCQYSLQEHPAWSKHLSSVFKLLQSEQSPFRIIVSVYTQPSVLLSLVSTLVKEESYLSTYTVFIDYLEENKFTAFEGSISWNGKPVDQTGFLQYLQEGRGLHMISKTASVIMGEYEPTVLSKLQLKYQNYIVSVENGKVQRFGEVKIKNNQLSTSDLRDKELVYWIEQYHELLKRCLPLIQADTFGLFR